jgi:hypothetical protein
MFRDRYTTSKVFFLLVVFTGSYATSKKQQSVLLVLGRGEQDITKRSAAKQGLFLACFSFTGFSAAPSPPTQLKSYRLFLPTKLIS